MTSLKVLSTKGLIDQALRIRIGQSVMAEGFLLRQAPCQIWDTHDNDKGQEGIIDCLHLLSTGHTKLRTSDVQSQGKGVSK